MSTTDVTVGGLVQGWDLSETGILRGASGIIFTAPKTFLGPVHITGNFTVLGGVHGIDFDALCRRPSVTELTIRGKNRTKFFPPFTSLLALLHTLKAERTKICFFVAQCTVISQQTRFFFFFLRLK